MRFIQEFKEGSRINGIYLCRLKQHAMTKNGKPYVTVMLTDKTGNIDAKIWDPNSNGIEEFDQLDYVEVTGDVHVFAGSLQMNIKRLRRAVEDEYDPADYIPVSDHSVESMTEQLESFIDSVQNPWLSQILTGIFRKNPDLRRSFETHSAAKTVHHGFVGGLMEHTLSVTRFCDYMVSAYPILNRDLLITAALLHDIGKTKELSGFPMNDYTDAGQLLGHIVIGSQMIHDEASRIEGFPELLENELIHCILSHHGELEYGSPKRPALAEAVALNIADSSDAKMETLVEAFAADKGKKEWLGFNRYFESNLRRTDGV